jgi:predicted transposase YdaD
LAWRNGLGVLPIAPLTAVAEKDLPAVITRMDERIVKETDLTMAEDLWTSTFILMGLTYEKAFAAQLLKGVRQMEESVTYQAILDEGRVEGVAKGRIEGSMQSLKKVLRRQGEKRFGTPSPTTQAAFESIDNLGRLELMTGVILDAASWEELLAKTL